MAGLEYIRRYYGVPAKRGMRVTVDGHPATITGASGPHLRVRFGNDRHTECAHPTWRVEYPAQEKP